MAEPSTSGATRSGKLEIDLGALLSRLKSRDDKHAKVRINGEKMSNLRASPTVAL